MKTEDRLEGATQHAATKSRASYDAQFFEPLFKIEDRHFWFRARNLVIATLVKQTIARFPRGYRVLEVGCGTGNVLRVLEEVCHDGLVIGMDLFPEGLYYAQRRTSAPLVQGDAHMPPFAAPFHLIGLFDVLEHLPDDEAILRDLHNMLAPGGALMITVPAHKSLWSYFDEAAHHCRRYEVADLRRKLKRAGYRVEFISQYQASIFPLVWLGRRLAALRGRGNGQDTQQSSDDLAMAELKVQPSINAVLTWILTQETRVIARRHHLPIGTSLVAVARRVKK